MSKLPDFEGLTMFAKVAEERSYAGAAERAEKMFLEALPAPDRTRFVKLLAVIATAGENANNESWVWPSYTERAFSGFRAYYDYVPKGTFEIEYTIRLNQVGTFQLPPTHVEALYEPEMLGELPNSAFEVAP